MHSGCVSNAAMRYTGLCPGLGLEIKRVRVKTAAGQFIGIAYGCFACFLCYSLCYRH